MDTQSHEAGGDGVSNCDNGDGGSGGGVGGCRRHPPRNKELLIEWQFSLLCHHAAPATCVGSPDEELWVSSPV